MKRLVLVFGIVSLLQGLSSEPNPEFGLDNTFTATARITSVKTATKGIVDDIKALTVPQISSGFAGLTGLKTAIENFIKEFNTNAQNILSAYDTMVASTDGTVSAIEAYANLIFQTTMYIDNNSFNIADAFRQLTYNGIADEVADAISRVNLGLTEVYGKVINLKAGLEKAIARSTSGTIDANILRQTVPLSLVYDFLRAASILKSYLPLLKYILVTAIENITEAETYLGQLNALLTTGTATEVGKFTSDIQMHLSSIKEDVKNDFAADDSLAKSAATAFNQLSHIATAPRYNDLKSATTKLSDLFAASSLTKTSTMSDAFDHIITAIGTVVNSLQSTIDLATDPSLKRLIDILLGNSMYGRYCFHKYKDLGTGLYGQLFDSSVQCVEKELERLEYLRITLRDLIDLMSADYEDIEVQTTACDSITSADNRDSCVAALATYYTLVYQATADKIDVVYQFATDEAVASESRILICFMLVYFEGSVTKVANISSDLNNCALDGPAGTKE